jgi:hypothetical protein
MQPGSNFADDAFARAQADIPACALDEEGLQNQRERHAALAPTVARLEKTEEVLLIDFEEGFDRQTLDELLATERQCCPFFQFDFDEQQRRLRVTVKEAEQLPALEAVATALTTR